MSSKPAEIAREGLAAWRQGDFGTVEEILDPNVKWHATEPAEWDCHGRDEVMQTLRGGTSRASVRATCSSGKVESTL